MSATKTTTSDDFDEHDELGPWSVVRNPALGIDKRTCTRQVPFRIVSAGFPRTGTASLQRALSILGYPTYHFAKVFPNCRDADMWLPALDAKFFSRGHSIFAPNEEGTHPADKKPYGSREFFDQLLGDVSATTDVPACLFWEELLEAYGPEDVKVILVDRDAEAWQRSFDTLIDGILDPFMRHVLARLDPGVFGRVQGLCVAWVRAVTGTADAGLAKARARQAYENHYERVRQAVPRENLLEYKLGSGWEPLCEFLDVPVPDRSFPHINEAQALQKSVAVFGKVAMRRIAVNLAVAVGMGAIAVQVVRRVFV